MIDISDLKLDRARRALSVVRDSANDQFLKQLADISLLLLDQALSIRGLPEVLQKDFEGDLKQSLVELSEFGQKTPDQIDRAAVFWPFFFIAKLILAKVSLGHGYQQTDVQLREFLDSRRSDFVGEEKIRVDYLLNGLGWTILDLQAKQALSDLQVGAKRAEDDLKAERARGESVIEALSNIDERAQQLSELLKDRTGKLNFIVLSKGFSRLSEDTEHAIRSPLFWLRFCSVGMLVAPVAAILMPNFSALQDLEWWQTAGPLVTIELVFFFFFRVLLQQYRSLKAQLLQINLRFNLCAFVEDYSAFSSRVRKSSDDRTLDKFEALIFSGITPDPQNVPSQFDGIDQITNLLKALRSGEKP